VDQCQSRRDDASIADFPDFLADWIERTSVQETRSAVADDGEKGAQVHEDFDFDNWCAAYPKLDFFGEKAGIHVFKTCPWKGDHHTNNGRPDYRATVLFQAIAESVSAPLMLRLPRPCRGP